MAADRALATPSRPTARSRGRRVPPGTLVALVGAITVAGLLLRLPSFNDSLFGDEVSTYFIATGHDLRQAVDWVSSDLEVSPPLFFVLAWATHSLGGPAESLRLVSLAAGVAAIPLTYVLGVWTVGRRAALLGSALVAISPFLILYSTQARAYALVLLLDLLSTLSLLKALDGERVRWWIAYALCSCAAVYAHYTAVFVLAGQLAWALWTHPRAWRGLVAANVAAAAAFLPWLPEYLDDRHGPNLIGFFEPFGLHAVARDIVRLAIAHPFIRLSALPGAPGEVLALAGVALGLAGLMLSVRAGAVRRPSSGAVLVLVLAGAAPAGAALYSAFGTSVFNPQNLIASWPGLALSAGVLAARAGRILGPAAAALMLAALAVGAVKLLDPAYQRPDYAGAVRYIDRVGPSRDPVVDVPVFANPITALDVAMGFGRRGADPHPVLRLGVPPRGAALRSLARTRNPLFPPPPQSPSAVARKAARLAGGRRVFLVALGPPRLGAAPSSGDDPLKRFVAHLPPRYRLMATRNFHGFPIDLGALGNDFSVTVYVLGTSRASRGPKTAQ